MPKPAKRSSRSTPARAKGRVARAPRRGPPVAASFEEVWRLREEERLPSLVGPLEPGIVTLDEVPSLTEQYGDWEPLWNAFGVLRSAPSEQRRTYLYVTSGLTTPVYFEKTVGFDSNAPSGCGYEIAIETPKHVDWPVLRLLSMMAYNLGTRRAFAAGHRWPFGGPVDGKRSTIVACVFVEDGAFALPTGRAKLLRAVGITAEELAYAKEHGSEALIPLLATGPGLVTPVRRPSVVRSA